MENFGSCARTVPPRRHVDREHLDGAAVELYSGPPVRSQNSFACSSGPSISAAHTMICRIQAGNQARIGLELVQGFLRDAALLDFAIWLRRHLPALVRGRNQQAD